MLRYHNNIICLFKSKLFKKKICCIEKRYIFSVNGVLPHTKLFKDGKDGTPSISRQIEEVWKKRLEKVENDRLDQLKRNGNFVKNNQQKKKYILAMFPYPSGHLHMGHVRVYTISDILSKYYKMNGYQVLHPIGWDAFGLPAENAALERQISADSWTYSNIETMKTQLQTFGCNFNWENELATCDPEYYKWTQLLFLKLYNAGLAYQQEAVVNWDPVDNTVLANEQVDTKGRSWRSGAVVEKRTLRQWFISISKFNNKLTEALDDPKLQNWDIVGKLQRNWMGKNNGYRVILDTTDSTGRKLPYNKIFSWFNDVKLVPVVDFIGLSEDNALNKKKYHLDKKEKYTLLNVSAVNPITNKKIPIIISNSFKFLKTSSTFIAPCYIPTEKTKENDRIIKKLFNLSNNKPTQISKDKILNTLKSENKGGYLCSLHSKDWLVSRQRYWGTPIPIIHCKSCGVVPVPQNQLPVTLPKMTGKVTTLKDMHDWINCSCPECGGDATRETDTLDTFVDSSWYFLRYTDSKNKDEIFNKEAAHYFMPVDVYVGGIEHAHMHLYYARFINRFLYNTGHTSHKEPFKRLLMIGQVKAKTYKLKDSERYLRPEEVDTKKKPYTKRGTGERVIETTEKMGKSKHNGINPLDIVKEYGVDSTRLMVTSAVHPYDALNWSTSAHYRQFQMRLYGIIIQFFKIRGGEVVIPKKDRLSEESFIKHQQILRNKRNDFIVNISSHFEDSLNISKILELLLIYTRFLGAEVPTHLIKSEEFEIALKDLLVMLYPIIPHLSSELWVMFCHNSSSQQVDKESLLMDQRWPLLDDDYIAKYKIEKTDEEMVHEAG